jgi:hypothetical protein
MAVQPSRAGPSQKSVESGGAIAAPGSSCRQPGSEELEFAIATDEAAGALILQTLAQMLR